VLPPLLPLIIFCLKPRTSLRLSLRITFSLSMGELVQILPYSIEQLNWEPPFLRAEILLLIARQKSFVLPNSLYGNMTKMNSLDFIFTIQCSLTSDQLRELLLCSIFNQFLEYHIYFENTIDKSNFVLAIKFDGGREFCTKITCFIQIIVKWIRDIGHECYIKITFF